MTDTYYLIGSCELNTDGTWKSSKEVPTGFKVIKLVDQTKLDADPDRFIEYPYSLTSQILNSTYTVSLMLNI